MWKSQHSRSSAPTRQTNVLHVVGQLDMGGMEKLLVEFARHANRERFHLHFLSIGRRGVVADEIESLGWKVTALGKSSGLDTNLFAGIASCIRKHQTDVIHTHNPRPFILATFPSRLLGVRKVVHTRHGQGFGRTRRELALLRFMSFWASYIVSVSQDSHQLARADGLPPHRLRMLWNGIDISRFRYSGGGDGPVLAVGRLSPEKDFATLIRAAAIAVSTEPTFRLDVAGDGVCMPELQQLVTELGIQHAVRLLGQRSDIQQLLAGARMAALSSVTEGISLTLLEAMASGLPVVATAVGGNPELVVNNLTGLLVPPQQPEILAKAMVDLWRDPHRRQGMGQAGRARVEEFFDVRKMVAEYEKLYLA